ncbi:hypothetical protein FI667_g2564, partial [Globisporangium splendens]
MQIGVAESAFPVDIEASSTVGDLKEAIKHKKPHAFGHLDANRLTLFAAKRGENWLSDESDDVDALEHGDASKVQDLLEAHPLRPTLSIDEVFANAPDEEVIYVLVRLPQGEKERIIENVDAIRKQLALKQLQHQTQKEREWQELLAREEQERLERLARIPLNQKRAWDELNIALLNDQDVTASKPFSSVTYESLPKRFIPTPAERTSEFYKLMTTNLPAINDDVLDEMTKAVTIKSYVYDEEISGNEATRVQLMSTLFENVVYLFRKEDELFRDRMKLGIQVKMEGDYVRANGVVDFLISRGKKSICVIEAKDEQFRKGKAQSVLGMEVSVEQNDEDVMYGIVTNYEEWRFLKRTVSGIEEFKDKINPESGLRDELKRVASRIYAILC